MTDEQILDGIGLSGGSDDVRSASLKGVKQVVSKRVMGILESLLDEDQVAEIERRTEDGSSFEHNIDWIQRALSVDVQEIYDATLSDYVSELRRNTQ